MFVDCFLIVPNRAIAVAASLHQNESPPFPFTGINFRAPSSEERTEVALSTRDSCAHRELDMNKRFTRFCLLSCRCHILCEWDCFAEALLFVGRYVAREEAFYPVDQCVLSTVETRYRRTRELTEARLAHTATRHREVAPVADVLHDVISGSDTVQCGIINLPCILAMCGSAFVLLQVNSLIGGNVRG